MMQADRFDKMVGKIPPLRQPSPDFGVGHSHHALFGFEKRQVGLTRDFDDPLKFVFKIPVHDRHAHIVKQSADKYLALGEAPRNTKLPAPDVAATAVLASTLMNHDEFVMKR